MTDQRLRGLERRWKETGDIADEAAYLNEKARAGLLEEEWLELAARLGYAAARACRSSVDAFGTVSNLFTFLEGTRDIGLRRRIVFCQVEAMHSFYFPEPLEHMVEESKNKAVAFILNPVEENWNYIWCSVNSLEEMIRCRPYEDPPDDDEAVSHLISHALQAVMDRDGGEMSQWIEAMSLYSDFQAHEHTDLEDFRAELHDQVIPWLLGYGDPLRQWFEVEREATD